MSVMPPIQRNRRRASGSRALVLEEAIGRMAKQIAQRFRPDKIILFGSQAYGQPTPDSDVDILVVMRASNETNQAVRIRLTVDHPFPLDLIVRTPQNLRRRLKLGDWFLREVVSQGKVLYEKVDGRVGAKGRRRSRRSNSIVARKATAQ